MKIIGQRPSILLVVTQANWGGAQKYIFDLASHLYGQYDVSVAAGTEDSDLKVRLEKIGVPFHPVPALVRAVSPFSDLQAVNQLKNLIRLLGPDIVHLNSSKAGVLGSIAAKLAGGCKVVFTIHGLVLQEPLSPLVWVAYWLAERLSAPLKDLWIAVSEADRLAARRYGLANDEKIKTIPIGLDFSTLSFLSRSQAREKLSLLTTTDLAAINVVGTIADFYPTKGLRYLAQAASEVVRRSPQTHFVVIGRGNAERLQTEIRHTGITKSFHIISSLSENAASLLPGFDLFVLSSVKEGLPYTLLEAAAAKLPILATSVGGIPDVIEDGANGLLVPPQNSAALAEAVLQLLSDPIRGRAMGMAAAERVKEFSLKSMVQKTKSAYATLG
ncbi:MAG: hypothetical protein A2722_03140 [Candidatus Doudnabacteria bacterium RIFCSPHIGHO2_01_FULL_50_11]|uniref:Glycosyltransferase subfamily 4-like N-terminal domain-containing protein n=1 Tax=Candidatus Doudnabacteria bacterium RIFCSPHIGHO2_01_FULL_50_11 TaxID=1817828 RepID=A0A1F5PF61_9BACT|nr:MAG: hypothetical protein A2722_03140 [Candidatus Doudnabacteria bacterium RIFCSPHIGHO2_01_FULL_50_11]HLC44657.1 glycosyltransferase family 4 protein [Patescibacteria group bacterium]